MVSNRPLSAILWIKWYKFSWCIFHCLCVSAFYYYIIVKVRISQVNLKCLFLDNIWSYIITSGQCIHSLWKVEISLPHCCARGKICRYSENLRYIIKYTVLTRLIFQLFYIWIISFYLNIYQVRSSLMHAHITKAITLV